MNVCIFPGQGSQFVGMGRELYDKFPSSRRYFEIANRVLGFDITALMFNGAKADLFPTRIAQPAIFLYSIIQAKLAKYYFRPNAVAGHSLGEITAITASNALSFESGLTLVNERAMAMDSTCQSTSGGMAVIIGLEHSIIENICAEINEFIVPANFNTPTQLVISGTSKGLDFAINRLKQEGASLAIKLPVAGAFHSKSMEPARLKLQSVIEEVEWNEPRCPVYQNADGSPNTCIDRIKHNLLNQLTQPVYWSQTIQRLIENGADHFYEVGGGKAKVLEGMLKSINKDICIQQYNLNDIKNFSY